MNTNYPNWCDYRAWLRGVKKTAVWRTLFQRWNFDQACASISWWLFACQNTASKTLPVWRSCRRQSTTVL